MNQSSSSKSDYKVREHGGKKRKHSESFTRRDSYCEKRHKRRDRSENKSKERKEDRRSYRDREEIKEKENTKRKEERNKREGEERKSRRKLQKTTDEKNKFLREQEKELSRKNRKQEAEKEARAKKEIDLCSQAYLLLCRIYVGNINFEVSAETIRKTFIKFGPIRSFTMPYDNMLDRHKGYVFIDYELAESAKLAVKCMKNFKISGREVKVVLQSFNISQSIVDKIVNEGKDQNSIFIASIHPDVTEADMQTIFEPFGKVVYCKFSKKGKSKGHNGFGFIEFETNTSADNATNSLDGLDIGGIRLRIVRGISPFCYLKEFAKPDTETYKSVAAIAKQKALEASQKLLAMNASTSTSFETRQNIPLVIPPPALVVPQIITPPVLVHDANAALPERNFIIDEAEENKNQLKETLEETEKVTLKDRGFRQSMVQRYFGSSCVIVLRNMVGPEDVDEMLQEELDEECKKFGELKNTLIYKEKQSEEENAEEIIKIFLEYTTADQAQHACKLLNGRYFGGRTIEAKAYDQSLFDYEDYSG